MLNAFASLKCSKKCEHNVQRPTHAAVICLVTQRSSPQTAAETWTTFLAHCVCDKFSEPIMHQQNENDVSFRAKKRPVVSGLHVPDIPAQN